MAKTTSKPESNKSKTALFAISDWEFTKQHEFVLRVIFLLFSVALFLSFTSFFLHGNQDQTSILAFFNREDKAQNWLGKSGAWLANLFIYKGFGIAAFILVRSFFLTGLYLTLDINKSKLKNFEF